MSEPTTPRPTLLPVKPEGIPAELKAWPQWVVWRYEWVNKNGKWKWDKPPRQPRTGSLASPTDPSTWDTYENALAAYQEKGYDGIGFGTRPQDPFLFADHDDVVIDRTLNPGLERFIRDVTYAEMSPSGAGIRQIFKGKLPGKGSKNGHLELYDDKRYLTITGQKLHMAPDEIRSDPQTVAELYKQLQESKQKAAAQDKDRSAEPRRYGIHERGGRIRQLFGILNSEGLPLAEIERVMLDVNQREFDPPKPEDEILAEVRDCWEQYSSQNGQGPAKRGGTVGHEQEAPAEIPWQTAAEIAADTPAEVTWLWKDYLALGTVVELDAKLKAGKTTFIGHLVRHLLAGLVFLDRPVTSTPVVYMTEEGNRTFRAMLGRAGLTDRQDLHVLSKRRVAGLTWPQLVAAARAKLIETGSGILIVDTLGKLAGFKDDDENSAGKAMEAMTPLQALASELNIVIIVVRHDRKAGGDIGDSARGSSAFGGDVDVILHLTRVGGQGREKRRYLSAIGRFDETPERITLELTADGYREVSETDARDAAAAALLKILPDLEGDAVAIVDLLGELKEAGHGRTRVYEAAAALKDEGRLQTGARKGASGHSRTVVWLSSSDGGT